MALNKNRRNTPNAHYVEQTQKKTTEVVRIKEEVSVVSKCVSCIPEFLIVISMYCSTPGMARHNPPAIEELLYGLTVSAFLSGSSVDG
jgi:hypothetical protein